MPVVLERKPDPRRPGAPEPLRRPRVQPAAPSPRRRRALHYALIFVIVVLVADALVGERGLVERLRARRDYRELAASVEALRQENARLRTDIYRLRDDPATLESLARKELGLIKPGEVLFIIRDAKPAAR